MNKKEHVHTQVDHLTATGKQSKSRQLPAPTMCGADCMLRFSRQQTDTMPRTSEETSATKLYKMLKRLLLAEVNIHKRLDTDTWNTDIEYGEMRICA